MFVFPVLLIPSLTLCVFSSLFFPESLVVLFFPFSELTTFSLFFSSCLSPSLSHAGSFTSTSTLTSSPSPTVSSLCPLHGFVLLPQCQGPGDEVTLHRRAAGLTEPRPSPPSSSAQRTNRPAVSPPPAHYIFSTAQTTSPLHPYKTQGTHTNISFVGSSYQPGCLLAS